MKALFLFLLFPLLVFSKEPDLKGMSDEYFKKSKKANEHMARMGVLEKELRGLIAQKSTLTSRMEIDDVHQKIVSTFRELRREEVLFKKVKSELEYKYPAQGEELNEKYKALRLEAVEQEAKESGIDLQLSQLRDQVGRAYEPLSKEENPLLKPKPTPLYQPTPTPKREVLEF